MRLPNYLRMMDSHYDTYTRSESVDELLRDVNAKVPIPIFRELLSSSGSEPSDVREMPTFLPACKGKSHGGMSRYPAAQLTPTN